MNDTQRGCGTTSHPTTRLRHDLFRTKPDHRADCYCETGEGEIWLQADAAAKWRAS